MASYDFEVDLESLAKAAQGLAETVQLFKDKDVEDLVPSEDACGSEEVWGAVEEFKDRWERGMNNLCEDVGEMSGRIGKIAMNYFELNETGKTEMDKAKSAATDLTITGGGK
ncbi:hypothetical protein [Nocardioides sp. NPDC127503]|jgi:hypothetical protein|uniref:hypothetical protein n=1 Tax=unclassified Nocardioides TaxID=2615069 RepID=UPI0027BDC3C5|nr:hypothetical protein [Actinomycetota bacterium]